MSERGARVESVRPASGTDLERARSLRSASYRRAIGLDPRSWDQESARDAAAYVLVSYDADGEPLVCGRALPVDSGLAELAEFGELPASFDRSAICEVSRLARGDDAGRADVVATLYLGAQWLLEHTGLRYYVAYTRPQYLPLYEAVGAKRLDPHTFTLTGRSGTYAALVGSLATARDFAARAHEALSREAA